MVFVDRTWCKNHVISVLLSKLVLDKIRFQIERNLTLKIFATSTRQIWWSNSCRNRARIFYSVTSRYPQIDEQIFERWDQFPSQRKAKQAHGQRKIIRSYGVLGLTKYVQLGLVFDSPEGKIGPLIKRFKEQAQGEQSLKNEIAKVGLSKHRLAKLGGALIKVWCLTSISSILTATRRQKKAIWLIWRKSWKWSGWCSRRSTCRST